MKIIFFFGTKISKKKLGENILWHTHITSLSSEVRYLWFIVIYRELLWMSSLYFSWILVVSCVFKGVKCPRPNRKTQETTRNHKKFTFFLRGLRGLSVSVKSTFLQYCELMWFLVKIILVFSCGFRGDSCDFLW